MTAVQISSQTIPGTNITISPNGTVSTALTSQTLDQILGPQVGALAFRDSTQWRALTPGTQSFVLVSGNGDIPTWTSLSSAIDTAIGGGAGSMLYRSSLGWATLTGGTQDQILFFGGSATPGWRSFSAQLDASFQAQLAGPPTQGAIIFRNSTIWNWLAAGNAGQVLQSGGAGANPSWVTPTVTSAMLDSAFSNTQSSMLYRGAAAWQALAPAAASNYVLTANGINMTPTWISLSSNLDTVFGSAQGSILYRGAAAWTALGPGSAGNVLTTNGAAANPSWNAATAVPIKNYLNNAGFQISQENGTTAITAGGYPADCWLSGATMAVGAYTLAQVAKTTPGGSPNRIRLTVTTANPTPAAGDYWVIITRVEGYVAADLLAGTANAKTVTFRIGCNGPAGTYGVAFRNQGYTRGYVGTFTIAGGEANTDVVKTLTVPLDTAGTWAVDNTIGLDVGVTLLAGSSYQTATGVWANSSAFGATGQSNFFATNGNVMELFDAGLYQGSVAPAWQLPVYDEELRKCQRQFWKFISANTGVGVASGVCYTTTLALHSLDFPVNMRAAPTCAATGSGGFQVRVPAGAVAVSSIAFGATCPQSARLDATVASGLTAGQGCVLEVAIANSVITANARL